jgi:hypothetical protein
MQALSNLQSRLNVAAGQIRSGPRQQNVAITKGLIQAYFEERDPGVAQQGMGLAIRFENALRRSKVETAAYECKQGLCSLAANRTLNAELMDRLVETACGIANIGPHSGGAIFIGVADNLETAERVRALDNVEVLSVGARYVVGVDRELAPLNQTLDAYKQRVVAHFRNSGLSEPLRASLLGHIDCIDYRGMSVLCIWIPSQRSVSVLDDRVFAREGSNTVRPEGFSAIQAVAARFD